MDVLRHVPKPLVEEHYHINDLIEAQEKRTADRTLHQNREKERGERMKEIEIAKDVEAKGFWCVTCSVDFVAPAYKFKDNWGDNAWYKTKHHPCGTWCMRNITDTWRDSYWTKSVGVSHGRGKHFADAVQPTDTNFNLLYGKK